MTQRHRHWFWFATFCLLNLFVTNVSAQSSLVGRLFFVHYGDLYSWAIGDSESTHHSEGGDYHSDPTLSPNGTHLAFRTISPEAWDGYYYEVGDIWLWDLQTDTLTQVTTNADFVTDQENVISRSAPTWSPDGTQIAWTEWNFPDIAIMIYDLETGGTRLHSDEVNFGFADGSEYQPQEVAWGRYISKEVFTYFEDTGAGTQLSIYDDEGRRCSYQLDYHEGAGTSYNPNVPLLTRLMWVEYDGVWWMGLQYEDQPYRLMNPDTGEHWEVNQTPALRLSDDDANETAENQRTALEENAWSRLPERARLEPSPDGQYLASQSLNDQTPQITIWHNGIPVFDIVTPRLSDFNFYITSGFEWSTQSWRLPDEAELTPVEPFLDARSGDCSAN